MYKIQQTSPQVRFFQGSKNVIRRRFMSNRKYQKMVCDITELKAKDGSKVYLEIIKDLATSQILT